MTARRRPTVTTCVALGALAAELVALRVDPAETLCPDVRRTIRTLDDVAGHRAGQVVFTVAYAAFSAWFLPHILRPLAERVVDELEGSS